LRCGIGCLPISPPARRSHPAAHRPVLVGRDPMRIPYRCNSPATHGRQLPERRPATRRLATYDDPGRLSSNKGHIFVFCPPLRPTCDLGLTLPVNARQRRQLRSHSPRALATVMLCHSPLDLPGQQAGRAWRGQPPDRRTSANHAAPVGDAPDAKRTRRIGQRVDGATNRRSSRSLPSTVPVGSRAPNRLESTSALRQSWRIEPETGKLARRNREATIGAVLDIFAGRGPAGDTPGNSPGSTWVA
jgi:hypothetical protein